MGTAPSQPHAHQRWKYLFQAALFEADARAMAERIALAEDAIIERAFELQRIYQFSPELQDLTKALCSLGDLRRRKISPHPFSVTHGDNSRAA